MTGAREIIAEAAEDLWSAVAEMEDSARFDGAKVVLDRGAYRELMRTLESAIGMLEGHAAGTIN